MNVEVLKVRAKIVKAIRRFFDERGFVEVETAVRIPAPAPEEHIDCPVVIAQASSAGGAAVKGGVTYLRASPELQMKKLLAAGLEKIYQIGPCFREGEKGSRHNPEFTMIEWYRKDATYLDIAEDLKSLVSCLMLCKDFRRETEDATQRETEDGAHLFTTLFVRDAYVRYAGWDPWVNWDQDRFDFDMATKIEPAIKALGGGVFLMDYPPQAASLAKLSTLSTQPSTPFAERWEFYWDGMELANCFTELCDRDEQLRRFEQAKENRKLLKESDYPIDCEFIDCLPKIGRAAGVALGVDRLVMVLTQTKEISAVRPNL